MFILARAIAYSVLFIGVLLVYLPARVVAAGGLASRSASDIQQVAGMVLASLGAVVAVWCILSFVSIGRGTPAPFDPPRRLVVRGPYRFVRNPMYIGAAIALGGAALSYSSLSLLTYTALFFAATHLLVIFYEEPALGRSFGAEYEAYRHAVRRWVPRWQPSPRA